MFDVWKWALVPISVFYTLCAIFSLLGNGIMIIVFFKNPKLKLPFNILITLNCLADIFHLCGHFIFTFQLFTETTVSQAQCFYLLSPTVAGYCISGPILLVIGIDRLIACSFPMRYRQVIKFSIRYTCLLMIFPILYTSFLLYSGWQMRDFNTQVTCMAPLAMNPTAFRYYSYSSNFINLGIVIVYAKTYWTLQKLDHADAAQFRNIFKSILVTVIIVLIGWATLALINSLTLLFVQNPKLSEIFTIYSGFGVNIACSCNLFVFYSINQDYRFAIRLLIGMRRCSIVQPTTQTKSIT